VPQGKGYMPEKKIVFITGCSSGFGLVSSVYLASKGYQVIATMRNLDKRHDLLNECKPAGCNIDILQLDVTDVSSIDKAVDIVYKRYGRIDVLVNNAGYAICGFFEDLSEEDIRKQMDTNFFGVQNVTRRVIPIMRQKRQGKIINISSISGLYALPGLGAYNASKWALEGFSESLRYELKVFGIDVILIEPGPYKTKIFTDNACYARGFNDKKSLYYDLSQYFVKRVDKNINRKFNDPKCIAVLIEKLITSKNPSFRNIPDFNSRMLYFLRKYLPFRIFSMLLEATMFANARELVHKIKVLD